MKCPACPDTTLLIADRQGIEIDYCPKCRGVWLDRGELDRLIEHSATSSTPHRPPPEASHPRQPYTRDFEDSDHRGSHDKPHVRRRSWLSDIFD